MANESQRIPFVEDRWSFGRNHAEFTHGDVLVKMVREDLIAQRITIEGCRDIIHYLSNHDAPTCRRLADILVAYGERATDTMHGVARRSADAGMDYPRIKSL